MSGVNLIARFMTAYKFTVPLDQVQDNPALSLLSDLGLIECRASKTALLCDACDFPHPVKIGIDPVTDKLGWRCRDAGFVAANSDQLGAVRFLPDVFVSRIATALGCQRRRKETLIEHLLWRIGWYEFEDDDVNVFLASRMRDAGDLAAIAGSLEREPSLRNGLVVAPEVAGVAGLTIAGCRFVSIEDVVTLGDSGLFCDSSRVARLAGISVKAGPGRHRHGMRSEVAKTIRFFYQEERKFRSKRKAVEGIQEEMRVRMPETNVPGRTVIEEEIDSSEFGCFLVGN